MVQGDCEVSENPIRTYSVNFSFCPIQPQLETVDDNGDDHDDDEEAFMKHLITTEIE